MNYRRKKAFARKSLIVNRLLLDCHLIARWKLNCFALSEEQSDRNRREGLKTVIAAKREDAKRERLLREYDAIVARHGPILNAKLAAYIEHGLKPDISRVPLEAVQAKVIQLRGKDKWKVIGDTAKTNKGWLLEKHILPHL